MKTFLIVIAILILLGIVIFLLIRKPERVIDDNSIAIPDSSSVEEHSKPDVEEKDARLSKGIDYTEKTKDSNESGKAAEEEDLEVHIPEHCKIDKCDEGLPNKYFFNIHKYTSKKGREMFCVVCSAVINNENYRIIVRNTYYPYLGSYTLTLINKIESMFEDKEMSVEEFIKLGSINFVGVGKIVANF